MLRQLYLLAIILLSGQILTGQDFVTPLDHTQDIHYKKDELLVKFKDEVKIHPTTKQGLAKTGLKSVDDLFEKYEVTSINMLFPGVEKKKNRKTITFPDGTTKKVPQLFNIYHLKTSGEKEVKDLIDYLNSTKEVAYAEVNGEAYITDMIPTSEAYSATPKVSNPGLTESKSENTITPNDPLYSQQWSLPHINADDLWVTTTGDTTQIISILDTGVDDMHPDLQNKIWQNEDEIPDNGIDDDNNGFVDDTHGWDFVNQDNDPKDDNSHGTHCAGIAGAETNNGVGMAGVSWGAKIMPVKVFQSNGIGYFSQIAQGFWYAAENGATVYSNSWSSSGESLTIRNAMEYAYAYGIIVAAAGNMGYKTDYPFPPWPPTVPNYPACYSWVLGVEATNQSGNNTWFSNYDPTGPIISDGRPYGSIYFNNKGYNYEMRAPGLSFISTVPDGQYRNYSGTSMACPLVAGSVALMKSYNPDLSHEQVFAKLIQPIKEGIMQAGVLDIEICTFTDPPSDLYYVSHTIADSLYGGDDDGRPDAGETIDMYVSVKNAGGQSDTTFAKLRFAEFEDTTTANIIDSTCLLGSISAYAQQTSFDPIKIEIDSNVVHYRIISFELLIWEKGSTDTTYKSLTYTIEHGVEIKGTYDKLHLTGDAFYLVSDIAVIDSLIIDPGVTLTFNPSMKIAVNSYLHSVGKPDSLITYTAITEGYYWDGIVMNSMTNSKFEYCVFKFGSTAYNKQLIVYPDTISNCIFEYCKGGIAEIYSNSIFSSNLVTNHSGDIINGAIRIKDLNNPLCFNNIFAENQCDNDFNRSIIGAGMCNNTDTLNSVDNNVFINNFPFNFMLGHCGLGFKYLGGENYFGTTSEDYINEHIQDFYEVSDDPVVTVSEIVAIPSEDCHGVVWKVELNGQNPQEGDLGAIGAGPLRFDVHFNRPMDTAYTPFVTFGVRYPYTQNIVSDSAHWSEDSIVWTAYHHVDLSTGDGENTVRVAHAKDMDHFKIPIERSRFNFIIQAAGSQSVNFVATPGIGKVDLEWPLSDSTNVLGYNLYRYKMPTDSTYSDTTQINNGPIGDSTFTDFSVMVDSTYYYMFTVARTDFSESDYSKVVSATPLSAANGDANGSMEVNVLDITTIVNYMLGNAPEPFLFDAADVNYDGNINVLDIIGVVQIIQGNKSVPLSKIIATNTTPAYISKEGKTISLESEGNVAALSFELQGEELDKLKLLSKAKGFEFSLSQSDSLIKGVLYSLSGSTIPEGKVTMFEATEPITATTFGALTGGDWEGNYVPVLKEGEELPTPESYQLQAYPNPFTGQTTIQYDLPEQSDVTITIYDMGGKVVWQQQKNNLKAGNYEYLWSSNETNGMYLLTIQAKGATQNWEKQVKLVQLK